MSGWQIQLLGNTMVHLSDDTTVTISDVHARALLAYLALERQRPHRRRALIALLWPDEPANSADELLQHTLELLSDILDSDQIQRALLEHSRFRVMLRVDNEQVIDVDQFRHAVIVSERHPHQDLATCASCQRYLSEAAVLYQGAFLEGLELPGTLFANWLVEQRNALRAQALHVFGTLTDIDMAQGDLESAIIRARKQLLLDPWSTTAHQQLMTALTDSGQIDQALSHYEGLFPRYKATFQRLPDAVLTAQYDRLRSRGQDVTGSETIDISQANVPAVPIINVGREVETSQIRSWLTDPKVRALVISGPGGIGKTQLALKALQAVRNTFNDGIAYIPLLELGRCSVDELDSLVQHRIHGFEPANDQAALDRAMLIILDNAEVVQGTLHTWLTDFFDATRRIKVVLCTQAPLDVPGKMLDLSYLPVPTHDDSSGAQGYASVRMFKAYAQAVNPAFELSADNIGAVVQICRAVAGLPLGIQLAAMWVSQFTVKQLANAMEHDLDVIISPNETIPQRHRSLRFLFLQMFDLLTVTERSVLLQTAVFAGGFDAETAQQIIRGDNVIECIQALVNRGLLLQDPGDRYTLVPTVAAFAREILADPDLLDGSSLPGELDLTAQRHSRFFRGLLSRCIAQWYHGDIRLQAIEVEMGNIQAAWRWLERHTREPFSYAHLQSWLAYLTFSGDTNHGVDVCDKLSWYLKHNLPAPDSDPEFIVSRQHMITRLDIAHVAMLIDAGRLAEVDEVLARTVRQVTETNDIELQVEFNLTWGKLFMLRGDYAAAQEQFSQAWRLTVDMKSPEMSALNLLAQGYVALRQNNEEMAQTYFEQTLDLADISQWRWIACEAQCANGQWHLFQGSYGLAQKHLGTAWQLAQDLGATWLTPKVQLYLGMLDHRLGNLEEARSWLEIALSLSHEHHHRVLELQILTALADLFLESHDHDIALQTAQQAIEPSHSMGLLAEEAGAMLVAARVLEAQHQIEYALAAYLKVQPIYERLAKDDEMPVVHAGVARCEEQRGHHDRANRRAERIVHRLRNKGQLLAFHEPMHIYSTCYDILVPDNPPRAVTVLRTGHEELQKQAKSIREPHTRATFLNKVAANRGITNRLQLYEKRRRF